MSKRSRVKSFLKQNYKYLIFCFSLFLFNGLFIYIKKSELGNNNLILPLILLCLQPIFCFLGFWLYRSRHWSIHRLFLLFALVLGLGYVFIIPIGTPPDEANHFRRIYEISEGYILSDRGEKGGGGRNLPDSINEAFDFDLDQGTYGDMSKIFTDSSEARDESFQYFGNTSLYSPLVYFPQVIGVEIGKILHLPMLVIIYFARIFNLIFWALLCYFAIKFIPIGKNTLVLLLLTPVSLQSATSCQADAFTTATIILFFTTILRYIKHPIRLSRRQRLILIALSIFITMSKIVYLPICFLLCLLPRKCFHSHKHKVIWVSIVLCVSVALNLIWLAISAGYLVEFNPGVNSGEQVKHILTHPHHYLATVFRTYTLQSVTFLLGAYGQHLCSFKVELSSIYSLFVMFFSLYTYLGEKARQFTLKNRQKLAIFLISFVCIVLITTSLYVQWTALDALEIDGIQGRYFIPIIPFVLVLIQPFSNQETRRDLTAYSYALASSFSLYGLFMVAYTYLI